MSIVMSETIWVTPAARARMEHELAELQSSARSEDLKAQARIRQLRTLLPRLDVDRKPDDGLVEPGMQVSVRFERDGTTATFLFGSRELASLDPTLAVDVYPPSSPLGEAIDGRHVGDTVDFAAPNGEQRVTVLAATPFG